MKHPIHQNKTMRDIRQQTTSKIKELTALGYHVKEIWECKWNGMKKTDPQLKAFVDKLDIVPPLNPREAFFGGRTNAIKLHHKVDENENEKIEYRDIISLYPCANLECDYPICHPEFIDQPRTTDISRYYGLIKCKILPPYELYCYGFPVCCMLCVTIYGLLMRTHEASLNSLLLTEPPYCLGCVVLK